MRVLQLTKRFPPALGGVESHVDHLARGLVRLGVQPEVITTDLRRDVPFERMEDGNPALPFPVHRCTAIKVLDLPHGMGIVAPSMVGEALRRPADVVHAHAYGQFPTFAGALVGTLRGVPLVVTPHSDPGRPGLAKGLFDHAVPPLTLRRARRVIAVTRAEAGYLRSLGVPGERVNVIPNGIDLGELEGVKLNRGNGPFTLLFLGRLDPDQKGLATLVRAVALLPPALDWRLRLIGEDWGGAGVVQRLAADLGVGGRVSLEGPRPRREVLAALGGSDLLVLPSTFEPFGIVLLEAMASGLPVVASRVGGIPEVVEDGRTGLLVPPGDAGALASALGELLGDPNLARAMGQEGRRRAAQYSWDALIPRVVQVYREAVEEGPA